MLSCGINHTCMELAIRLLEIGLSNGAIIALNAIGVTLVYSIVRLINFAHGDMFALGSVLAAFMIERLGLVPGMPPLLLVAALLGVLAVTTGASALVNVAVERVAFRPFRNGPRIAPLIATIGISFMLYQVALLARYATNAYIPGEHRSVPGIPEMPRFRIPDLIPDVDLLQPFGLRVSYSLRDALMPLLALALAGAVGLFLRSRTGRAIQACAQDPEMAALCGINRNHAIRITFAIGGLLSGAAACAFALYYTHPYTLYGAQSGLTAFTAAVLGGIGRPRGAFWAGLLLGVVAACSDYFLAAAWTPVLLLALLILLLVLRPTGLGREEGDLSLAPSTDSASATQVRPNQRRTWLLAGLLALGAAYPLLDNLLRGNSLILALSLLVFVLLALGLNLVLGYAGLLDLGFAACFAIGAYMAGMLTGPGGRLAGFGIANNFLLVLLCSAAAAGLFGILSSLLTMRLRGEYLAIVTLAFGQLAPLLFQNLDTWTGGIHGMSALPPPLFYGLRLNTPTERYYVAFALIVLVALASVWLGRSRLGRAWAALSGDELAAISCGVPPTSSRVMVFALGAAVAGAAGAMFASGFGYVDPTQSEFRLSAMVLAMVVVGGAGSVPGVILGALIIAGYDLFAIPLLGSWAADLTERGFWFMGMFDVRSLNFLSFGLALYLTTLLRARPPQFRQWRSVFSRFLPVHGAIPAKGK